MKQQQISYKELSKFSSIECFKVSKKINTDIWRESVCHTRRYKKC